MAGSRRVDLVHPMRRSEGHSPGVALRTPPATFGRSSRAVRLTMVLERIRQSVYLRATRTLASPSTRYAHLFILGLTVQLGVACSASDGGSDIDSAGPPGHAGGSPTGGGGSSVSSGGRTGMVPSFGASPGSGAASGEIGASGASASGGGTANAAGGSTGSGGKTGSTAGSGTAESGATGSGNSGSGAGSAMDPVIPAINGTCPTFATGTATVAGLSGISLQVGAKKLGTGSLLFYWHGTGSSAGEVNSLIPSAARQEILDQGGIIVSFQGSLGTGGDCSGTGIFSKDDFKVADLIAACAVRDHGIDPRRIYTTGCSAGGLQAGCMGALRSSYIAATAPNSGGEVTKLPIQDPSRVPAVMTMHGGSSDVVLVSFATTSATYDTQMKGAGAFVINCNHGGGHCGAPAALQSAAWEFMKDHPFGIQPEPYSSALPSTFPSYCMAK
jgi:hypothetical protein